jgi:two-component system, OmpR family, response regulator RegX3
MTTTPVATAAAAPAPAATTTDPPSGVQTGAGTSIPAPVSRLPFDVMAGGRRTVLMVEDEVSITEPLREALEREGLDTELAPTASEALEAAERVSPDLVLLDVMLPDGSGFEVCRALRERSRVPIIMLTARGEETDRIVGLELGADDYIVKPFSAREVAARIRAVLRRVDEPPKETEPTGPLEAGELTLDPARRSATLAGNELDLTRREFELLQLLLSEAGTVITRERLIDEVWDTNWFGSTKTLDVHVSSLRRKLGDDSADPRFIHTVRGVGFRFAAPDELAAGS